jgi:mRNA interferase RelE/StbE
MGWEPRYTHRAKDDLAKLDKPTARRLLDKIDEYCASDRPLSFAKSLKGVLAGTYRFRVGDYRVIFEVGKDGRLNILLVLHLGHRREIYD